MPGAYVVWPCLTRPAIKSPHKLLPVIAMLGTPTLRVGKNLATGFSHTKLTPTLSSSPARG